MRRQSLFGIVLVLFAVVCILGTAIIAVRQCTTWKPKSSGGSNSAKDPSTKPSTSQDIKKGTSFDVPFLRSSLLVRKLPRELPRPRKLLIENKSLNDFDHFDVTDYEEDIAKYEAARLRVYADMASDSAEIQLLIDRYVENDYMAEQTILGEQFSNMVLLYVEQLDKSSFND